MTFISRFYISRAQRVSGKNEQLTHSPWRWAAEAWGQMHYAAASVKAGPGW